MGGAGNDDFIGVAFLEGLEEGAVVVHLAVVFARGDSHAVAAASVGRHHHMVGAPVIHRYGLFVD